MEILYGTIVAFVIAGLIIAIVENYRKREEE